MSWSSRHAADSPRPDLRPWRNRAVWLTGAALVALAALAWVVTIWQASSMSMSASSAMGGDADMGTGQGMAGGMGAGLDAAAFVGAWAVMMAAMMLPSATPMIALYAATQRGRDAAGQPALPTTLFAAVYLVVWAAIGVPVFLAGRALDALTAALPDLAMLLPYGVALVLLAAGLYQFSPLKRICLRQCQSPLGFLFGHWRPGRGGVLRLALAHAGYCVGCCWGLMAVLVVAGAMGLPWVLLIAAAVFVEKVAPAGVWTARLIGAALLALSVLVLIRPDLAATLRGQTM